MITGRMESFTKVRQMLKEAYDSPIIIVETGCVRGLEDHSRLGDGWSTYHWLEHCLETRSKLFSVDNSSHAISQANKLADMFFADTDVEYEFVMSDSIEFLQQFPHKIDLLFLDSYDYCGDEENVKRCHQHNLNEVLAAWDKLNDGCFVLIDDVFGDEWDGKGKLTIPYLLENGFELIHHIDSQALLRKQL
jgi:hypothetical protein